MIAKDLHDYMTANMTFIAPLQFPYWDESENSVALIQLQDLPDEIVYRDGTTVGTYNFEVAVKVKKEEYMKAIKQLDDIADYFLSNRSTGFTMTEQIYSYVRALSTGQNTEVDQHTAVWRSSFSLEYTRTNK